MLGREPIGSLLAKLSIPAMAGMIVNSLYNLVDTIFVGQAVGPMAIAGLSIAFPIQTIMAAVAMTFGTGSASIISRRLGERRDEDAALAAGNALVAVLVLSLAVMIIGHMFLDPILKLFGAAPEVLPYAREYVGTILYGSVFLSMAMGSNGIIRAEGQARVAMTVMITSAGLNIVLDPILIYLIPLGIRGAALATVISQGAACILVLWFFISKKSTLPLNRASFRPNIAVLRETVLLGLPAFARQTGTSLTMLTANNMLNIYGGALAVAAYGMILRLVMFVFMPIFGVVQGFQPIAGYNYGAKQFDRVRELIRLSFKVTVLMGTGAFVVIQLFPRLILSMFTQDAQLLDIAEPALRRVFLTVPLVGIQVVGATFFQAIGKSVPSLLLTLSRQFIFLIPFLLLLAPIFGLPGIWSSFPLADVVSTLLTSIWMIHELRRQSILGNQNPALGTTDA